VAPLDDSWGAERLSHPPQRPQEAADHPTR
jgi:hypothetical protein